MSIRLVSSLIALGVLVVLLLIAEVVYYLQPPRKHIDGFVQGADGRPSTSKVQWFLWTLTTIFGVSQVLAERFLYKAASHDFTVPVNLFIAMGFSSVTMASAKGITVAYTNSGLVNKRGESGINAKKGGFLSDDDGMPDLSKFQMMAFTLISIVTYLLHLLLQKADQTHPPVLVDIEPALMVLMGLSQGAYIGKKLVTTETPRIAGITPGVGQAEQRVEVVGINFGNDRNGSLLEVGSQPMGSAEWSDAKIVFNWPETDGETPWVNGQKVPVRVTVNARESNTVYFAVKTQTAG